jgi:hypothetical protein
MLHLSNFNIFLTIYENHYNLYFTFHHSTQEFITTFSMGLFESEIHW